MPVRLGQLGQPVRQALLDQPGRRARALLDQQDQQDRRVRLAQLGPQAQPVQRDRQGLREPRVQLVRLV